MKNSAFKMILLSTSLLFSGAIIAQTDISSGHNASRKDGAEPRDAHSPFPTPQGMTTPDSVGKPARRANIPDTSRTNKSITTKNAKTPSRGNGTDIINDRKAPTGAQGTTGGNTNSQRNSQ
jgi:hypothetical protein